MESVDFALWTKTAWLAYISLVLSNIVFIRFFYFWSIQDPCNLPMSRYQSTEVDWQVRLMVTCIVVFYTIAGVFLCRECWPLVKDIWRSYFPDKKKRQSSDANTKKKIWQGRYQVFKFFFLLVTVKLQKKICKGAFIHCKAVGYGPLCNNNCELNSFLRLIILNTTRLLTLNVLVSQSAKDTFSVISTQGNSDKKNNIEIKIYKEIVNTLVCIAIWPVLQMKARHKIIRITL